LITLSSIGQSYEGRNLTLLQLEVVNSVQDKPLTFITGAHHARELISIKMPFATLLNILHGYLHQNPEALYLANNLRMAFVPIVNPDGVNLIEEELQRYASWYMIRESDYFW